MSRVFRRSNGQLIRPDNGEFVRSGVWGQIRESDELATVPNAISALKAVLALGVGAAMITGKISKKRAAMVGIGILMSDKLDGSAARLGVKQPKLQAYGFRPTETGKKLDPVTDKTATTALLVGGLVGGYLSPRTALMVPLDAATAAVSYAADRKGSDLHVPVSGKLRMFSGSLAVGADLLAHAVEDRHPELAETFGNVRDLSIVASQVAGVFALKSYIEQSRTVNDNL